MKLTLFFVLFCSIFAVAQQDLALVVSVEETKKESSNITVYYDTENHLLTLLASKEFENIQLELKTETGHVIYKEEGLTIRNHYLLSISSTTPKGTYCVELKENGNLTKQEIEL